MNLKQTNRVLSGDVIIYYFVGIFEQHSPLYLIYLSKYASLGNFHAIQAIFKCQMRGYLSGGMFSKLTQQSRQVSHKYSRERR